MPSLPGHGYNQTSTESGLVPEYSSNYGSTIYPASFSDYVILESTTLIIYKMKILGLRIVD